MEDNNYLQARKKVKKIKEFYSHAVVYITVNILLLMVLGIQLEFSTKFWSISSFSKAFGWGIGLILHGLVVFKNNLLFGKEWEQHKIEQYIQEEINNNTNRYE